MLHYKHPLNAVTEADPGQELAGRLDVGEITGRPLAVLMALASLIIVCLGVSAPG